MIGGLNDLLIMMILGVVSLWLYKFRDSVLLRDSVYKRIVFSSSCFSFFYYMTSSPDPPKMSSGGLLRIIITYSQRI